MTFAVTLSPLAVGDLIALDRWITTEAGEEVAEAYLQRVYARIASLREFSARGTLRDDLVPGIRTLVFERRLIIAYRIEQNAVLVLSVISARRELAPLFDS